MTDAENETSFKPSKLGTKQYWDEAYQVELENFNEFGDEGEIWFGKQCEKRIVDWCTTAFSADNSSVLDIGSGNGHMLLSLAKKGFKRLQGVDYSENAVQLGRVLFSQHSELPQANFQSVDFLNSAEPWIQENSFDLLIDKGTFDAISLMPSEHLDHREHVKGLAGKFKASLAALWRTQASRFVLTSCNWTRSELEELFSPEFIVEHQIEHPKFSFGGASGQVVTSLVFKRQE